jgi:hypothetical protein
VKSSAFKKIICKKKLWKTLGILKNKIQYNEPPASIFASLSPPLFSSILRQIPDLMLFHIPVFQNLTDEKFLPSQKAIIILQNLKFNI